MFYYLQFQFHVSLFANTALILCQKAAQCAVVGINYSQYVEEKICVFVILSLVCFHIFFVCFRISVSHFFRIFLYFLKNVHLEAVDGCRTLQS